MQDVSSLDPATARALEGVLFDLDDTFLEHTQLSLDAYAALFALRQAGLRLVVLTGRPASWAELIVRMWPVDAAIAENGSVAYTVQERFPLLLDTVSAEERAKRRGRLDRLVQSVRQQVPGLVPANDVSGRLTDFTFDIGEAERPSQQLIDQAVEISHQKGARTTRSSVHLHLTFDRMDKASGAIALLSRLGHDATRARSTFAFVGDSQNDAAAFAAFTTSCGVANLSGRFSLLPRYRTQLPKSRGFCQFAHQLCRARNT